MPSAKHFTTLAKLLSPEAQVLTEQESPRFKQQMLRWSEIGLKIPSAIILPSSEIDCQRIVTWAVTNKVHFVVKSGGMSLYSTIGEEGIIIDLANFASVAHDKSRHEVVLMGGVTTKVVAVELAKDGHCTTLPSSNPVGAIPFFLNGGNSPLVSKLGYGSDNIISARMITATGELINVTDVENRDLLYAIRGAGQYFGIVTSLIVRTYPNKEIFGNDDGIFWSGRFVFPIERAQEIAHTMEGIVNNKTYCNGGLIMVAAPPPAFNPAIVVIAKLIHRDSESVQKTSFKSLYDLEPIATGGGQIRIENNGDALQPLMTPGGFKKLRLTGIHSYDPEHLVQLAATWKDLTRECPDAKSTIFGILFESQATPRPNLESANGMHSIRFWSNSMIWCRQQHNVPVMGHYLAKAISVVRTGQADDYVDFTNSLREPESHIKHRYRGSARLEKLHELKGQWDADGIFGKELLLSQ